MDYNPENKRVKSLRFFLGWTQKRMAESLQVSVSGYNKIENENQAMTAQVVLRVVEAHNVEFDWIMGKIGNEKTPIWRASKTGDASNEVQEPAIPYEVLLKLQQDKIELQNQVIEMQREKIAMQAREIELERAEKPWAAVESKS